MRCLLASVRPPSTPPPAFLAHRARHVSPAASLDGTLDTSRRTSPTDNTSPPLLSCAEHPPPTSHVRIESPSSDGASHPRTPLRIAESAPSKSKSAVHHWHRYLRTHRGVEVVLSGLSYNAPDDQAPIATFQFRQPNGTLSEGYTYNLTNDGPTSIWQFAPSAAQSLVKVTYDISNFTLQATCQGNTSQCMQGFFQESGFLSFSLTDSFNSTVTNLRAVDKDWVYGHSDDAPSFLLKEVQPDGSLGKVVVRTAVTQPGHCMNLKLCANDTSIETLVPIGLTLMKQNEYSRVCTTPNSN
ncbi:hypothetical protein B0H19DRAFT_1260463 [Mycena capillaripes]|nr:hypothetical protein B0H19DRAFT_1260463 [Mycena capillaripes]